MAAFRRRLTAPTLSWGVILADQHPQQPGGHRGSPCVVAAMSLNRYSRSIACCFKFTNPRR